MHRNAQNRTHKYTYTCAHTHIYTCINIHTHRCAQRYICAYPHFKDKIQQRKLHAWECACCLQKYSVWRLTRNCPQYLEGPVFGYHPARSLRSKSAALLIIQQMHGVMHGNRFFRKAAATLWNNLPFNITTLRHFKKVNTTCYFTFSHLTFYYFC